MIVFSQNDGIRNALNLGRWDNLVPRSHSVLHLAVGDLGTRLEVGLIELKT